LGLSMVYPDEDDVTEAQVSWIGGFISCMEEALFSDKFTDATSGASCFILSS